jgi:hypothetical protein
LGLKPELGGHRPEKKSFCSYIFTSLFQSLRIIKLFSRTPKEHTSVLGFELKVLHVFSDYLEGMAGILLVRSFIHFLDEPASQSFGYRT